MGYKRRTAEPGGDRGPRPPKAPKRRRDADADLDQVSESDYYVSGDLRYVVPYLFQYRMSCKKRWRGRRILDVFNEELSKHNEPLYWRDQFAQRRLVYSGRIARDDDVWEHNRVLIHSVHRHESPVLNRNIAVVHADDNYLVVDKPPSIPVHPCGTYRKASLTYLLAVQGWRDLRLVHRLDKQTSGVVIFARTREAAASFVTAMTARSLRKRYLARVRGRFPRGRAVVCDAPLSVNERTMRTVVDAASGKDARTLFYALAYDAANDQSLVVAEPQTGRSHQIRVHLAHMGFSIANDPAYDAVSMAEAAAKAEAGATAENSALRLDSVGESLDRGASVLQDGENLGCSTCPFVANRLNVDVVDGMVIYLHALEYEGDGWLYTTKLPSWASVFSGADVAGCLRDLPPLKSMAPCDIDDAVAATKSTRLVGILRRPSMCAIT